VQPGRSSLRPPYQRLLRLLAWCPVLVFTPASLELGVFVWTWLLAAAPPLQLRLLADLTDAWLHCAATQRGLFSCAPGDQGERALLRPQLTAGEPEPPPERDPVAAIHAHRVWLGFFQDRFQVSGRGRVVKSTHGVWLRLCKDWVDLWGVCPQRAV
jgi:phosphatidylinositol 4-kinase